MFKSIDNEGKEINILIFIASILISIYLKDYYLALYSTLIISFIFIVVYSKKYEHITNKVVKHISFLV